MSTYRVRDSFRDAILECSDITAESFPHLFEIKKKQGKTSGGISKITKQAFRRLMIFIARLYQAKTISQRLKEPKDETPFSFAYSPKLQPMFECIEMHLRDISRLESDHQVANQKDQSCGELIHSITSEIAKCQKTNTAIQATWRAHFVKMEEAASELAKKVKTLQNKKVVKAESKTNQMQRLIAEAMREERVKLEKEKKKHKKKKKKKKRKRDDSDSD